MKDFKYTTTLIKSVEFEIKIEITIFRHKNKTWKMQNQNAILILSTK